MNPPAMTIPGLSGHTTLLAGNTLLAYGGLAGPFQLCGESFTLDLSTFEWNRLLTSGSVPAPRAFHSAVMVDWRMVVFGGVTAIGVQDVHFNAHNVVAHPDAVHQLVRQQHLLPAQTKYVADCEQLWPRTQQQTEPSSLHILDIRQKECSWMSVPAIGFSPTPRAHHSACVFRNCMFIAGGYSVYGTGVVGDPDTHACAVLHSLDLDNMLWRRVETARLPWPARWGCASGMAPDGRWVHACGFNPAGPAGSSTLASTSAAPSYASNITDQCLVLDLKKRCWEDFTRPDPDETIGPRRCVKAASVCFGGKLYVHGGIGTGDNELLTDFRAMDVETGEWEEIQTSGAENQRPEISIPSARCGHTATVVGSEFVIFGGLVNLTTGKRSNDIYALNLRTRKWRHVRCFVSEFIRRTILVPPLVDEALVLDPLPPKPTYSVDEIRKPGSTNPVPPRRALPWDFLEKPVERMQHQSMDARFPLGTAIEEAVAESLKDARQADIALRRSGLSGDDASDGPVVLWGDESTKTAVASARSALTSELNLRVKRLDDFTAAASSGHQIGDTLRQHFARDVAPIIRDATKWRESAAMMEQSQLERTDPFQDILFGFNREVRPGQVTVNTRAVPIVEEGGSGIATRDAPIARVEAGHQSYSTGLASYQQELDLKIEHEHDRSGLHKPSLGVRFVSSSIRRLGLENKLKLRRGDQPLVEDAKEQMKQYLASRQQARAEYTAKKTGATKKQ